MANSIRSKSKSGQIDRLVLYARNLRKNDAFVDRMCSSIREFGFKIPVLAPSDGEVVGGHLRIKAARKLHPLR
jgi:ParB-like chromosome segregation protein Spo0J